MNELSVLIPNYNHAHYLPAAIESVVTQNFIPREIVVIDDASTDNSIEVLEHFAQRIPSLRIIRNTQNRGVTHNCNRLLELSRGDILHFMAADDIIRPGFYESCVQMLAGHSKAGMCYALCQQIDVDGRDLALCGNFIPGNAARYLPPRETQKLLRKNFYLIGGVARLYRRSAVIELGGFREELGPYSDGFLDYVNMARHGVCFVPEILACWRIVSTSYSHAVASDDSRQAEIFRRACTTMEKEFRNDFPASFIRNYRFLALSRLPAEQWRSMELRRGQFADFVSAYVGPEGNRLDRAFQCTMRLLGQIERRLVSYYLRVRTTYSRTREP
jgi:hypothetical protein